MSDIHERLLQAIEEFATEAIQITDAEGNYIFCNQAFTTITGIPVEQRLGHNVKEVQPDGAAALVLQTGRPVYGHINSSGNGAISVANASPIRDKSGELLGAISVFNDRSSYIKLVQDLKDREEELRQIKGRLRHLSRSTYRFQDLLGDHPSFRHCVDKARQAAKSDAAILITGETGTGKELFAHAIHGYSGRADNPFVRVNCPAIPAPLLESELFGHEKGAFTDAHKEKPGKFELAQNGSIFLDEIGDMDITLQAKLLRVLQEREVERIGATRSIPLNVRVISATNQDLNNQIRDHRFRRDLYYRLNVIHIDIPPLRQRRSDIPLLLAYMMKKHNDNRLQYSLTKDAMKVFVEYDWPGNVRELENTAERLLLNHSGPEITREDALYVLGDRDSCSPTLPGVMTMAQIEALAIRQALERHGTSLQAKKAVAAELGISLSGLYKKIQRYGLTAL